MALSKYHLLYAQGFQRVRVHCWLSRAANVTPSFPSGWVRALILAFRPFERVQGWAKARALHGFLLPSIPLSSNQSHISIFCSAVCVCPATIPPHSESALWSPLGCLASRRVYM